MYVEVLGVPTSAKATVGRAIRFNLPRLGGGKGFPLLSLTRFMIPGSGFEIKD